MLSGHHAVIGGVQAVPVFSQGQLHPGVALSLAPEHAGDVAGGNALQPQQTQENVGVVLTDTGPLLHGLLRRGAHIRGALLIAEGLVKLMHDLYCPDCIRQRRHACAADGGAFASCRLGSTTTSSGGLGSTRPAVVRARIIKRPHLLPRPCQLCRVAVHAQLLLPHRRLCIQSRAVRQRQAGPGSRVRRHCPEQQLYLPGYLRRKMIVTLRQNAKKLPVAEGVPGFPVKPGRKQLYVHCGDTLPKIRLRQTFQRIMMSRDLAVELQQHPIAEVKLLVHTSLLSQTFHCANHTVVIRLRQRSIHQQLL